MIHGIGVDIVHLPRIQSLLTKTYGSLLARRILHRHELIQYKTVSAENRARWLGVRWAVKEACFKAVQPLHIAWKDVELGHRSSGRTHYTNIVAYVQGQPYLLLHKNQLIDDLKCSVSHDGEYIVGYVIAFHDPPK